MVAVAAAVCFLQSLSPSCCSSSSSSSGLERPAVKGQSSILHVIREESILNYPAASYPLLHLSAVCRSGRRSIPTGSLRGHGSREEGAPDSRLGLCTETGRGGRERGMDGCAVGLLHWSLKICCLCCKHWLPTATNDLGNTGGLSVLFTNSFLILGHRV